MLSADDRLPDDRLPDDRDLDDRHLDDRDLDDRDLDDRLLDDSLRREPDDGLGTAPARAIGPARRRLRPRRSLGLAAVALVLFAGLALLVERSPGGVPGDGVAAHLASHPGTVEWRLALIVSVLGSGGTVGLITLIVGAVLWARGRRVDAAIVVGSTAMAGFATEVAKVIVTRPVTVGTTIVGGEVHGFPSGHVCGLVAFVIAVLLVSVVRDRRPGIVLGTLAVIVMALTRIVVRAHTASDVVGGAFLGLAVVLTMAVAIEHLSVPQPRWLLPAPPARRPD